MKNVQYFLPEINVIAKQLLSEIKHYSMVALMGPLGAGKTTLTCAMLKALGVSEPVVSPTFTYVNQYKATDGRVIFHFDLYRLNTIQEFEQMGFFEYLDQPNSIVFIEWPEILAPILQEKVVFLKISSLDDTKRNIAYEL